MIQQPSGVQKASSSKRKKADRPLPRSMPVEAVQAALRINDVMLPCSIIFFRPRGHFVRDIL
jgi:hypothetical protein